MKALRKANASNNYFKNPKKRSFAVQSYMKCCLPKPDQSCHSWSWSFLMDVWSSCVSNFQNKRISSVEGDNGKEQFDKFLANNVAVNCSDFKNFDFKVTRLDEFLKICTMSDEKYSEIWKFWIFVFTFSHGQSSVESNLFSAQLAYVVVVLQSLIIFLQATQIEFLRKGSLTLEILIIILY